MANDTSQYRGKMSLDSMILLGTIVSGIAYGARHDQRNIHNLTVSILLVGVIFAIGTFVLCVYSTGGYGTAFSWRPLMTCWLLLLATASTALQIKWTLLAFITKRQDVSPSAFIETNINNRIYVMLYVL